MRRAFAPHVDLARKRLVAEQLRTMNGIRAFGNETNAAEIDARGAAIRAKIAALDTLHVRDDVDDVAAAIHQILHYPPLPPLDGEL